MLSLGALSSPRFLRLRGLGGAVAELIATTPGLVRRAGISDASSRGGFRRAGDGRGGGRMTAWARKAKRQRAVPLLGEDKPAIAVDQCPAQMK